MKKCRQILAALLTAALFMGAPASVWACEATTDALIECHQTVGTLWIAPSSPEGTRELAVLDASAVRVNDSGRVGRAVVASPADKAAFHSGIDTSTTLITQDENILSAMRADVVATQLMPVIETPAIELYRGNDWETEDWRAPKQQVKPMEVELDAKLLSPMLIRF